MFICHFLSIVSAGTGLRDEPSVEVDGLHADANKHSFAVVLEEFPSCMPLPPSLQAKSIMILKATTRKGFNNRCCWHCLLWHRQLHHHQHRDHHHRGRHLTRVPSAQADGKPPPRQLSGKEQAATVYLARVGVTVVVVVEAVVKVDECV